MDTTPSLQTARTNDQKLNDLEEEELIQCVLDWESRGFPLTLAQVEDMANSLLRDRRGGRVGPRWAQTFITSKPHLKGCVDRVYNSPGPICEDADRVGAWYDMVRDLREKYTIHDSDIYNLGDMSFLMGPITIRMVITRMSREERARSIRRQDKEVASAIECISADGWCVPPLLVVKAKLPLDTWYAEGSFPDEWVIKTTEHGWPDNDSGLDWIEHFHNHTAARTKGVYRMLIFDGHDRQPTADFERYCMAHNIITACLPYNSYHLLQPLDVGCFGPLGYAYGQEIRTLRRVRTTYIDKLEFFHTFYAAHKSTLTPENIRAGFKRAGLLPFCPDEVLSQLIRVRNLIREPTPPASPKSQVTKPLHNSTEVMSQSVSQYPGVLAKVEKTMALVHTALQGVDQAFPTRRQGKRGQVKKRGSRVVQEAAGLITKKDDRKRPAVEISGGVEGPVRTRRGL
jgi:hypothetical protein